jgi:hypothetical protein
MPKILDTRLTPNPARAVRLVRGTCAGDTMVVTDSQCGGLHDESDVKSLIERVAGGVL